MKPTPQRSLLTGLALTAGLLPGHTQSASISAPALPAPLTAEKPAAPKPSATQQWIQNVKNPTPWLSWGGDLRIRNEYYDNLISLGNDLPYHEQDVIRFRARLWTAVTPVTNVTVNARLAAEPREWLKPAFVGSYKNQTGMEWRYGIADNLNVKWGNVFEQPLTIVAGRQDIVLGDYWNWWLVADGTPLDGSWTYYLDSARVTYDLKSAKTKLDFIGIYQNAYADEWMPTINNQHVAVTEQDEQGGIFYASNKSIKNTQLDGYFIYKHDERELANGDDADIYTVGGKLTGTPAMHWSYSLEGAYQFGRKQDPTVKYPVSATQMRDLDAFGANGRLSYLLRDPLNNQAHLVFEYLSGDDGGTTGKDEMFDVLWGRWPRWSELYIYSYVQETGGKVAQLNNIERVGAGWTLNPMKDMTLGAYYNALFAPQSDATRTLNASRFTGDGNFRGHYMQLVLKHQFSKQINAHLWGEWVWQGDYYSQRDVQSFLRAEVQFTF